MKVKLKQFLSQFLPSRLAIIAGAIFFAVGFILAFFQPQTAHSIFGVGFFLGNIELHIQLPQTITFDYLIHQFVFYLGAVAFRIFINNIVVSLLCIFSGVAIIPSILIGLFSSIGAVTYFSIAKFGVMKGLLVLLGCFHLYLEFAASLLAIDAFLKFYGILIDSFRAKSAQKFKNGILNEFMPLILRIIILFALAALLEVFWSTWWVYIMTNHYVSWYEFYFGAYSVLVH